MHHSLIAPYSPLQDKEWGVASQIYAPLQSEESPPQALLQPHSQPGASPAHSGVRINEFSRQVGPNVANFSLGCNTYFKSLVADWLEIFNTQLRSSKKLFFKGNTDSKADPNIWKHL